MRVMQREYRSKSTSPSQRSQFLSMWFDGMSARTIARETGVSPATVCRWINRWRQEGNVDNHKPPKGIYRLLSKRKKLHLERYYLAVHGGFTGVDEAFWRFSLLKRMASVLWEAGNHKCDFLDTGAAWPPKPGTPYY